MSMAVSSTAKLAAAVASELVQPPPWHNLGSIPLVLRGLVSGAIAPSALRQPWSWTRQAAGTANDQCMHNQSHTCQEDGWPSRASVSNNSGMHISTSSPSSNDQCLLVSIVLGMGDVVRGAVCRSIRTRFTLYICAVFEQWCHETVLG